MSRRPPKDKKTGLPKKYVPASLSAADRKKQIESIKKGTVRPKVDFDSRRSPLVAQFQKKYGYKINNFKRISKEIMKQKGIDLVMNKGRAAYFTAGSRPNQTPESWALARLASVLLGKKARKVDQKIWDKYKI